MDILARFVGLLLLAAPLAAFGADSPLPPPEQTQFKSPNGRFLAISDPSKFTTTIYEVQAGSSDRKQIWSMLGWIRTGALSNDGTHILAMSPYGNLVPLDFDLSNPVIFILKRGEIVKTLSVLDIVRTRENLNRTVSHYEWCEFLGQNDLGDYRIRTTDGRLVTIKIDTGNAEF